MRPVVVQQMFKSSPVSGPYREFQALLNSSLSEEFDLRPLVYNEDIHGIDAKMMGFYARQLSEIKPDLFVVRGLDVDGISAIKGAKKAGVANIIVGIHGFPTDVEGLPSIKFFYKRHFVEIPSLRLCKYFYTVSDSAVAGHPIVSRFAPKYFGSIHNFVADHPRNENLRFKIRASLGVSQHDPIGIYSGRIEREKGILELSKALEIFFSKNPSSRFRFIYMGTGPMLDYLKKQHYKLIEERKIFVIGPQNDVWPWLFASDVFIFPTHRENHSIALLEACEAGLFIISTYVGGNKETLLDDNSVMIGINDPYDIVEKLQRVLALTPWVNCDLRSIWCNKAKFGHFDQKTFEERTRRLYWEALK